MTDQDKLIELHEKIEKLDKERDVLRAKLDKQSTWYKNPAMITALLGVLGGSSLSLENMLSRSANEEASEKEDTVNLETHRHSYKYILKQQAELEEMCSSYTAIVVDALSATQRRHISAQIKVLGLPELDIDVPEARPPAPRPPRVELLSGGTTELMSGSDDDVEDSTGSEPDNVFDAIRQQVEQGHTVNLDEVGKRFAPRKQ